MKRKALAYALFSFVAFSIFGIAYIEAGMKGIAATGIGLILSGLVCAGMYLLGAFNA